MGSAAQKGRSGALTDTAAAEGWNIVNAVSYTHLNRSADIKLPDREHLLAFPSVSVPVSYTHLKGRDLSEIPESI